MSPHKQGLEVGRAPPSLSSRQLGAAQLPNCSAWALLRVPLFSPHQLWAPAGNLAETLCSSTDTLMRSHTKFDWTVPI